MGGLCYEYAKKQKKKRLAFYSASLLTNLDKGVSIEKNLMKKFPNYILSNKLSM